MDELIRKQDAIDAVETIGFDFSNCDLSQKEQEELCEAIGEVRLTFVHRIFDVKPAQQWILVSERLPEEGEKVIVQYSAGSLRVIERVSLKIWNLINSPYAQVVAWMPAPEPWKGEKDVRKSD